MRWSREDLLHAAIAPLAAVILTLIFFAVFDRWHKLADPINSIVTTVLAVAGFGIAVGIDRWQVSRRRASSGKDQNSATAG
jgi:hypothetical protein